MWNFNGILILRYLKEVFTMSSIERKIKRNMIKNSMPDIELSMRFLCPKCNFTKVISRKTINSIKPNEFQNNPIFKCDKCNTEMHPYQVIADF